MNLVLLELSANEVQLDRKACKVFRDPKVQLERLVRREIVAPWD